MTREYFIERLKEASAEGWEKALATYEDDVEENLCFPLKSDFELKRELVDYAAKRYEMRKLPFQWIPCFGLAARTAMVKSDWDKLSKKIRQDANYVCEYCGEQHPEPWGTECHEEWEYSIEKIDDEWKGTYHLRALKCVCKKCHEVCHPGSTVLNGGDIEEVFERYKRINDVDDDTLNLDYTATKYRRDKLSMIKDWQLEDSLLKKIEKQYGVTCRPITNLIQF